MNSASRVIKPLKSQKKAIMSTDEIKLLKLGDYLKLSPPNRSDEYYMVTEIDELFKLRKVGNNELLVIEDPKELEVFTKVNTTRD